ncbi:hypothetical protein [Sphingobacterium pedocola]|uniref:Uncharacterized protein n=1 Tax=Sphingobacterium pedocola TaxID=2082722 RepID=A0ABR9T2S2_9SPHI|nr:hypothetical protein [Sphingobacterium pedocola]MBE8719653.1 hypothetical protein [Sphingobacterium pedocola]
MDILIAQKDIIRNILLTESYRAKSYVKKFNYHIESIVTTCSEIIGTNIAEDNDFKLTNSVYNRCQAIILESLDDVDNSELDCQLDNLEDLLYDTLGKQARKSNKKTDQNLVDTMLDLTIGNIILNYKFDYFSESNSYNNPWKEVSKILFENNLVYTFSDDLDRLKDIGLKINKGESELLTDHIVGVVGKGNKENFATGYFRDLASFKNLLLSILSENKHFSNNPIKTRKIIETVRELGITENEFTDQNIKNWVIDSLKRSNRLGSNNDGYFVIANGEDLIASYKRHLESFKGYYATLERHKKMADKFGVSEDLLNLHNQR